MDEHNHKPIKVNTETNSLNKEWILLKQKMDSNIQEMVKHYEP
jgi:hypothetical protein